MNNTFGGMQTLSQSNLDSAMKLWSEWGRSWQAIAAEMGEYQKRSFEDGTQTFQKLLGAKSVAQALEMQSSFAKRSAEQYLQEMNKIGGMYASLAKDAVKPVERLMQPGMQPGSPR